MQSYHKKHHQRPWKSIALYVLMALLVFISLHCGESTRFDESRHEKGTESPESRLDDASLPEKRSASEEPVTESIPESIGMPSLFRRDNLVAWALVPFDAKKRNSTERAEMLKSLGFTRFAYDWREHHIPEFEKEILAVKKAGLQYFAFWGIHETALQLFKKHQLSPQIWWFSPSPEGTQAQRLEKAVKMILPEVRRAASIGGILGVYNHLGWGGEPENMVAIVERIQKVHKLKNIGIVYNFHHGHGHIKDFARLLKLMKPYLLCVNLNGMNDGAKPKIVTIGKGRHERRMLQILRDSGYRGPVGIIAHQASRDAKVVLQDNINGLKKILEEQDDLDALSTFAK